MALLMTLGAFRNAHSQSVTSQQARNPSSANSPAVSAIYELASSPPLAPTGLSAAATGGTTVNLNWTNNAADATAVCIERSTDGVNFTQIAQVPATTSTSGDTGASSQASMGGEQNAPANDGICNLMKYALGLISPLTPVTLDISPQPVGGHLTISYSQLTHATDLTYTPEASSDLVNWSPSAVSVTVTEPDTGSGVETVQATDSALISGTTRRFLRLRVTSP
jgi:hypothetical protein